MDYLSTVVNGVLVAGIGILITFVTRTQIRDLKEDIRELKDEFRHFKAEMNEEFRQVRTEIASLRSDLTQVALALGTQLRPKTG